MDRNYLLKKKQNCSKKESEVFIAENYCDQTGIILSTNQSHKENAHMREDNDRVCYLLFILFEIHTIVNFYCIYLCTNNSLITKREFKNNFF